MSFTEIAKNIVGDECLEIALYFFVCGFLISLFLIIVFLHKIEIMVSIFRIVVGSSVLSLWILSLYMDVQNGTDNTPISLLIFVGIVFHALYPNFGRALSIMVENALSFIKK
jgi:hypothetical protein